MSMFLDHLWLIETSKEFGTPAPLVQGVVIETCLRHLRLGFGPLPVVSRPHMKAYEGVSAYQRLLRISAGLCSHLPGETNVFGQIKKVLSEVQSEDKHLKSMTPKLFEDTKFIRTQFLRGVGSHVYGQAVQQLLEDQKRHVRSILVLGAGDMAKNVAPCLRAEDIWLYNRTPHRSIELQKNLEKAGQRAHVVTEQKELDDLISTADVIVIGLPPLLQEETHFVQSISNGKEQMVIHLGRREHDCGPWAAHEAYFSLDDVFDYGSSQTLHLRNQLADATKACATRAALRALGEGVFTAHGWEDMHIVAKAPAWCSAA
jgi:hypothetical protein